MPLSRSGIRFAQMSNVGESRQVRLRGINMADLLKTRVVGYPHLFLSGAQRFYFGR